MHAVQLSLSCDVSITSVTLWLLIAGEERCLTTGHICEAIFPSDLAQPALSPEFDVGIAAGVAGEILPETLQQMTKLCRHVVVDIQVLVPLDKTLLLVALPQYCFMLQRNLKLRLSLRFCRLSFATCKQHRDAWSCSLSLPLHSSLSSRKYPSSNVQPTRLHTWIPWHAQNS